MAGEEKKRKRRALIITVSFHAALTVLFILFGFTVQDPPIEDGIPVNFGYTDSGSGNTAQAETQPQETVTEPVEEVTPDPVVDDVATQETVDAPSISDKKEEPKKPVEEKKPEEPKPSSELNKLLGDFEKGNAKGEGVTKGSGDQGDPNGDPNSANRTGNGGTGNSGNYRLGGRKALAKPKPDYNCPDEGRVVVKIYVNRSGKVIGVEAGEKIAGGPASNTTSECLCKRAEEAARNTTWQGDPNAPDKQVGYIIYNFYKN
jgi:outer membrane biosynthesis protein TonB